MKSFNVCIFEQEGQGGPGSLTWIFEMTRANFFVAFRIEFKEFLCVCTVQVQVAPIH